MGISVALYTCTFILINFYYIQHFIRLQFHSIGSLCIWNLASDDDRSVFQNDLRFASAGVQLRSFNSQRPRTVRVQKMFVLGTTSALQRNAICLF